MQGNDHGQGNRSSSQVVGATAGDASICSPVEMDRVVDGLSEVDGRGSEAANGGGKQDGSDAERVRSLYTDCDVCRELPAEQKSEARDHDHFRRDYARVIHSPSFRRLQGKTQLFPGHESDFFRNRLTHSLEVAQIAESIAYRLNATEPYFKQHPISTRLCATAGLMHDLGHPPFGHNGEHALDNRMLGFGGFEGNAQTLRIIARLEKKAMRPGADPLTGFKDTEDCRLGLSLTHRTLAAALKYDNEIPHVRESGAALVKGYYADDAEIVKKIKGSVAPAATYTELKTIECSIMDVADDIAYSTYDLEDSLKAGFLTPLEILNSDPDLLQRVAKKVTKATGRHDNPVSQSDVLDVLLDLFSGLDESAEAAASQAPEEARAVLRALSVFKASRQTAANGYDRAALSSEFITRFLSGVCVEVNYDCPALSKVYLNDKTLMEVEILKNYNFEATIFSPRLRVTQFRGFEVVTTIFDALAEPRGYLLMPDDVRALYRCTEPNATARMRVICDFVAGMTDRYAMEFYGRLHSEDAESIFKPI